MVGGSGAGVEPAGEDFDGGGLVDEGLLAFGIAAGVAEFGGGVDGAVRLINEVDGHVRESFQQPVGETADLGGGGAFLGIEVQGEAEDESDDATLGDDGGDAIDGIGGGKVDGFHRMGEDAKGIGGGDADAGIAVVDSQGWKVRGQSG